MFAVSLIMGVVGSHHRENTMRVYLAGPIFGCTDKECKHWRARARAALLGVEVLDPMERDYRYSERDIYRKIVKDDKSAIDRCDLLLVNFLRPSVGTSMEILYAWERKKHVLIFTEAQALSPWLLFHSNAVVRSLEDAVAYIWRLVRRRQVTTHQPTARTLGKQTHTRGGR